MDPGEGAYLFHGQDVSRLDDQALSHVRQHQIGFIFQSFHLVPRLTAEGNVALPMVFAGIPPQNAGFVQRKPLKQWDCRIVRIIDPINSRLDNVNGW